MWTATLIFFSCVAAQVTSDEIKVECSVYYDLPKISDTSPSLLADLQVKLLIEEGHCVLNISWAISIDASIQYLTGTRLMIDGEPTYLCEYHPNLAEAKLTGSKQKWFYHLVKTGYGFPLVQVTNLPWPPSGSGPASKLVDIHCPKPSTTRPTRTTLITTKPVSEAVTPVDPTTPSLTTVTVIVVIFGGLAGLLILCSCYKIYKNCGANTVKSLGFKSLPKSPVPVLMVYSAENSVFQQAVVALAEFLQWHGGCSVAVDMWQQQKIAELGPMRWLVEQVKAADRVLIVCPQVAIPSSQHSHSPLSCSCPEPSIPAAAHDLFPLILNMVASHAKSATELTKFWVVQLGEQQDKVLSNLALELRACKTFCLMKNFNKLCRSLHSQRQDNKKMTDLIFRPGISYSEKSTVKLREAVEKLIRHQPSIFSDKELLESAVISV